MTRKRMYSTIRQRLEDFQLPVDSGSKEVVDTAVDAALEYVLGFAQQLAYELSSASLVDEAKVAGLIVKKIKGLLREQYDQCND